MIMELKTYSVIYFSLRVFYAGVCYIGFDLRVSQSGPVKQEGQVQVNSSHLLSEFVQTAPFKQGDWPHGSISVT